MSERRLTILHLEDDPFDADLVAERLRQDGVEAAIDVVSTREDFEQALGEAEIDIVVSDQRMPDFSGLEALDIARGRRPDLPFVFFTGTMGEEGAVEVLRRGASDYVLKNRIERLVPALWRALASAEEHRARVAAEQRLYESEERFRLLAEHAEFGFRFSNGDGSEVHYVNPSFEEIWGRPAAEIYRRPEVCFEAILDRDRDRVRRDLEAWLAGHRDAYEEEYRVQRPDGTVRTVVETMTSVVFRHRGESALCSFVRDVTESRLAERQQARAQRLESIGTLAGGIAHDLNNTLAPILMAAEMVRDELPEEMREPAELILSSTQRAAEMVRQLLTFARGAEGEQLELRPKSLVEEVDHIVQATFPKHIAVRTVVPEGPMPVVLGDRTQLHQALLNLCVNSRDAMAGDGEMTIELAEVAADPRGLRSDREEDGGGWIRFTVRDTGEGIPSDVLDRVFDPFFSTKGADQGTGLGLSTTLGIIKGHSGFVRLDSTPGEGTTVQIYLPTAGPRRHESEAVAEREDTGDGHDELVLVIDDEAMILRTVKALLERMGYRPLLAGNGTEAMDHVSEHGEAISWVLCDQQMPGLDGLTLMKQLSSRIPAARLVAMSGMFDEERMAELEQIGVEHLLSKPFNRSELASVLT